MRISLLAVLGVLALDVGVASANHPCLSDGWSSGQRDPSATVPSGCPIDLYVPIAQATGAYTVTVDDAPIDFLATELFRSTVTRYRSVCSNTEPECWRDLRDETDLALVRFAPATTLAPGTRVLIGPGFAWATISEAGACPAPVAFIEEMCADPLNGPASCTGGDFSCSGGHDGGLACDGGFTDWDEDQPAAGGDSGGCATGGTGSAAGALLLGLGAALIGRRRRRAP